MNQLSGEQPSGHSRKQAILRAISTHLDKDQRILSGVDVIFERSGYSKQEILATFENVDDVLIALARRYADQLAEPLKERHVTDAAAFRQTLIEFGTAAWKEYSAALVGLVRLIVAEGARSKGLRDRVYEEGPARLSKRLCEFLAAAKTANILHADASLATEQLMGVLREPLYQALLLHSMAEPAAGDADVATAAIDLFLEGCARSSL